MSVIKVNCGILSLYHPFEIQTEQGLSFPSAVHKLAFLKIMYTAFPHTRAESYARQFTVKGNFGGVSSVDVWRLLCQQSSFTENGVEVDDGMWDGMRMRAMQIVLNYRMQQDFHFRNALLSSHPKYLLNEDTSAGEWGGSLTYAGKVKGSNYLGVVLMSLRDRYKC